MILTRLPSAPLWRDFVAQWRGNLSQGESFENKDKWEWKFTQMQKLQSVLWMAGALQTCAINQGTSPWWVVILFVCILLLTIMRKKHFYWCLCYIKYKCKFCSSHGFFLGSDQRSFIFDICQFWGTATLFRPVKGAPKSVFITASSCSWSLNPHSAESLLEILSAHWTDPWCLCPWKRSQETWKFERQHYS